MMMIVIKKVKDFDDDRHQYKIRPGASSTKAEEQ
jgi:hypothetical protein